LASISTEALAPSAESPGRLTPGGAPRFSLEELAELCRQAAPIDYAAAPGGALEKRLIEHQRTRWRRDDLSASLPFGVLESMALAGESYRLAFTPALLERLYRGCAKNIGEHTLAIRVDPLKLLFCSAIVA